ncbi:hypothetical protein FACS189413_17000 [Bacteroidia bacterium]|nr:hypothetical protein FACS189413_17000 [Bacteroidia bacterium]
MIFGNYAGATVGSPNENESIVFIHKNQYSIDKTPTIGEPNDDAGTFEPVRFEILYPDYAPMTKPSVLLSDSNDRFSVKLTKESDGHYVGNFYYCYYSFDRLYVKRQEREPTYREYWHFHSSPLILPVNWRNLWVGEWEIRIGLDQFVNIAPIEIEEILFKIFPNPVKDKIFDYQTELPVKSANSVIQITGVNGQTIAQYPISENKGKITLSPEIARGVYNVSLIINKKNYASSKIIVE